MLQGTEFSGNRQQYSIVSNSFPRNLFYRYRCGLLKFTAMGINYVVIAIIAAFVLGLVAVVVFKNKKDRKDLEHKLNEPDIRPEQHDKEEEERL